MTDDQVRTPKPEDLPEEPPEVETVVIDEPTLVVPAEDADDA